MPGSILGIGEHQSGVLQGGVPEGLGVADGGTVAASYSPPSMVIRPLAGIR